MLLIGLFLLMHKVVDIRGLKDFLIYNTVMGLIGYVVSFPLVFNFYDAKKIIKLLAYKLKRQKK